MKTIKKGVTRFFEFNDVFGANINFLIDNSQVYTSTFGGIISFTFIVFAAYYCLANFIDFARGIKLNIIYSEKVQFPNPEINFTETHFDIAYALTFDNNSILTPTLFEYFKVNVSLCRIENGIKKKRLLKTRLCTVNDFNGVYNDTNRKWFCIDDVSNIIIKGAYVDNVYQYIEYWMYLREDLILESERLLELLDIFTHNDFKIVFNSIVGSIDVENNTQPESNYVFSYIVQPDIYLIQKINLDFSKQQFFDDVNIFFEDLKSQPPKVVFDSAMPYSKNIQNRASASKDSAITLLKTYFRASSKMIIYKRQYQKFTEYVANMTGLLGQIFFLLYMAITYFNQFELTKKIMNHSLKCQEQLIYSHNNQFEELKKKVFYSQILPMPREQDDKKYNEQSQKEKETQLILIENKETKKEWEKQMEKEREKEESRAQYKKIPLMSVFIHSKKGDTTNDMKSQNIHDSPLVEREDKYNLFVRRDRIQKGGSIREKEFKPVFNIKLTKSIRINFPEKMFSYICCNAKILKLKNQIYEKLKEKYNYYMNILSYIKKLQEIDILKYIFLNKDQLVLLNFISKPSVSISKNGSDALLHCEMEKMNNVGYNLEMNQIQEIAKSYETLTKNSEGQNEINQNIIRLFNNEITKLVG